MLFIVFFFSAKNVRSEGKRISANYILHIQKLLKQNKKVSILINIPPQAIQIMSNPPIADKHNIQIFKKTISQKIYSGTVRVMMGYFSNNKNFSIVNRNNLKSIIKEQKLSLTGLLDDKVRVKVGRMIGANFIMSINQTIILSGITKAYTTINKLIEIQSGRELTSDESTIQMKQQDGKMITTYMFNGKDVTVINGKMYKK